MENAHAVTQTTKKKSAAKVIRIIVVLLLMIAIAFAAAFIAHRTGGTAPASTQVENGLSAYDLAVQYGYEGTVQDWLASLSGKSAYDIAKENGYSGTEQEWAASLKAAVEQDNAGIKTAAFSESGELLLTLTDNRVINLGKASGADGKDGAQGEKGDKGDTGAAGRGISNMEINDAGELVVYYTDGTSQNLGSVGSSSGEEEILIYVELSDGTYGVKAGEKAKDVAVIEIPDTYNGKAVTEIIANGFENLTTLQQFTFPNSLRKIGSYAFRGCTSLSEITIPENVTLIEKYAFYGAGLKSAVLPNSSAWHTAQLVPFTAVGSYASDLKQCLPTEI